MNLLQKNIENNLKLFGKNVIKFLEIKFNYAYFEIDCQFENGVKYVGLNWIPRLKILEILLNNNKITNEEFLMELL